jgi:hypothetical protein
LNDFCHGDLDISPNAETRALFALQSFALQSFALHCLACKTLVCGVVFDALLGPTRCDFVVAFAFCAVSR